MRTPLLAIPILGLAALATSCASAPPRPTVELTRASALVDQAQQSGAQRYAAADLQSARDRLQQADQAAASGDNRQALWLASEAALDAQLATARAQSVPQQQAADQLEQSLKTLRAESNQNGAVAPRPAVPPPASAPPPPPAAPPAPPPGPSQQ